MNKPVEKPMDAWNDLEQRLHRHPAGALDVGDDNDVGLARWLSTPTRQCLYTEKHLPNGTCLF